MLSKQERWMLFCWMSVCLPGWPLTPSTTEICKLGLLWRTTPKSTANSRARLRVMPTALNKAAQPSNAPKCLLALRQNDFQPSALHRPLRRRKVSRFLPRPRTRTARPAGRNHHRLSLACAQRRAQLDQPPEAAVARLAIPGDLGIPEIRYQHPGRRILANYPLRSDGQPDAASLRHPRHVVRLQPANRAAG